MFFTFLSVSIQTFKFFSAEPEEYCWQTKTELDCRVSVSLNLNNTVPEDFTISSLNNIIAFNNYFIRNYVEGHLN
jgi:hypothetical protein